MIIVGFLICYFLDFLVSWLIGFLILNVVGFFDFPNGNTAAYKAIAVFKVFSSFKLEHCDVSAILFRGFYVVDFAVQIQQKKLVLVLIFVR